MDVINDCRMVRQDAPSKLRAEQKNAPKLAVGCLENLTITLANWVIFNVR
jgi:hypothetical protein